MRLQTIIYLSSIVVAVFAGNDNTSGSCSDSLACNDGFCCSSHGFCGRTPYHCGGAAGCNPSKGSCGVVFLDKTDTPRVIPYEKIDAKKVKELADQLETEGTKLDPEQLSKGGTLESILQAGAEDKAKYPNSLNKDKEAANAPKEAVNAPKETDSTASQHSPSDPKPEDQPNSKKEKTRSPFRGFSGGASLDPSDSLLAGLGVVFSAVWIIL
ncbi:hypothetical protein BGZ73_007964 [Actinomortierella ambigua]|nr:hypothetical protein BGZ73_007964 [Actinomortierella ambigua]